MIQSWRGREAEAIFKGAALKSVPADLIRSARRRMMQLDAAANVEDMRSPPGNRLHLVGDHWSISVNMPYHITFLWGANGPEAVGFGDYH